MERLGFQLRQEAELETLTLDVMKTSEIEGENLNPQQVRSSVARRLGMDIAGAVPADRNAEGVVQMMMDATQNYREPLSKDRLFRWHAALFPTGHGGIQKITVDAWRDDAKGPMQVVSGPMGRERVYYEAPPANKVDADTSKFTTETFLLVRILVSFCDFLAGISQKQASRQEIGKSLDETRRMRGNQGNSHQMSC